MVKRPSSVHEIGGVGVVDNHGSVGVVDDGVRRDPATVVLKKLDIRRRKRVRHRRPLRDHPLVHGAAFTGTCTSAIKICPDVSATGRIIKTDVGVPVAARPAPPVDPAIAYV
jgi:hypothetical protein